MSMIDRTHMANRWWYQAKADTGRTIRVTFGTILRDGKPPTGSILSMHTCWLGMRVDHPMRIGYNGDWGRCCPAEVSVR